MTPLDAELGQLVEVVRGITFPTDAKRRQPGPGLVACLRTTNVQSTVDWDDLLYVDENHIKFADQIVRKGDILVSMSNSLELVGKCALVTEVPQRAAFGAFIAVVRARDGIDHNYVFHAMRSPRFRDYVREVASTTTNISNINASKLVAAPIPLFGPKTCSAIASRLDELFSCIDEGERALGRVQKLVERYRQSVLKAAVTGELTRDWREKNKDKLESGEALLVRILKARREAWEKAELDKMKAKGITPANDKWKQRYEEPTPLNTADLSELPEGWAWASLDQLTSKITSGSRDWKDFYGRGESVFVMAQNVRPRRLDLNEVQLVDPPPGDRDAERSEVRQHDLLVTIVGANTGDVCRVREPLLRHYVCQSVALARPVIRELSEFLELFLCASEGGQAEFAKVIYGAGRPHLSFDQLKATPIPLPPIDEQVAARDVVDLIESEIDSITNGIGASATSASALRQSVLRSAFSGSLVLQHASDEPASELLERIAAERSKAAATPKRGRKPKTSETA